MTYAAFEVIVFASVDYELSDCVLKKSMLSKVKTCLTWIFSCRCFYKESFILHYANQCLDQYFCESSKVFQNITFSDSYLLLWQHDNGSSLKIFIFEFSLTVLVQKWFTSLAHFCHYQQSSFCHSEITFNIWETAHTLYFGWQWY